MRNDDRGQQSKVVVFVPILMGTDVLNDAVQGLHVQMAKNRFLDLISRASLSQARGVRQGMHSGVNEAWRRAQKSVRRRSLDLALENLSPVQG